MNGKGLQAWARGIANKIENELQYPGQIQDYGDPRDAVY